MVYLLTLQEPQILMLGFTLALGLYQVKIPQRVHLIYSWHGRAQCLREDIL